MIMRNQILYREINSIAMSACLSEENQNISFFFQVGTAKTSGIPWFQNRKKKCNNDTLLNVACTLPARCTLPACSKELTIILTSRGSEK